jgi:MarR family transcriptional regulator, lower aerobic nicotinate degradation pathway regulator
MKSSNSAHSTENHDLLALYKRPGFLLRRAHQIAVSIFLAETASEGVTTTSQFGLMLILRARPGIDQISLARLIGLDRSTTGLVIAKLEESGLLERRHGASDRRRKEPYLTKEGLHLLKRLEALGRRIEDEVLSPFTAKERKDFLRLLEKFVNTHNAHVRIPMAPLDT